MWALKPERDERLSQDDRGRALLALLNEFGSYGKLAKAAGTTTHVVGQWVMRGFISQRGAERLAELTGREKEEFRPDLTAEQWKAVPPGRTSGEAAKIKGDAKLLTTLAEQYGGSANFCKAASIRLTDFHTWKSRGRIPAIKLPTLLAMRK